MSCSQITNIHLVIEDFAFTGFRFDNQRLVQDIKHILADTFELELNLLTIITDGANMLVRSFWLLFLFNGWNYTPRCTSSPNHVLVGNRQKISLINSKLASNLMMEIKCQLASWCCGLISSPCCTTFATSFMNETISVRWTHKLDPLLCGRSSEKSHHHSVQLAHKA